MFWANFHDFSIFPTKIPPKLKRNLKIYFLQMAIFGSFGDDSYDVSGFQKVIFRGLFPIICIQIQRKTHEDADFAISYLGKG